MSGRLWRRPVVGWGLVVLAGLVAARTLVSDWRLASTYSLGERGDISVWIGALSHQATGGELYRWEDGNGFGFTYPPFAGLVLRPLTWGDPLTVGRVWLVLSLALAVTAVVLVARRSDPPWRGPIGTAGLLAGVGVFAGSSQVQSDLITGQVNLVLAVLLLLDVGGVVPARYRGVLTGLAAAIKLTPLIAVGWFLLTRQWRAFAVSSSTFLASVALGFAVLPGDSLDYWTRAVLDTSRVGDLDLPLNASVTGVLSRAGVEPPVRTLLWVVLGGLLVLAAYARAEAARRRSDPVAAAILLGCAAIVASPISWPHHQIWLPLAGLVLLSRGRPLPVGFGAAIVVLSFFHVPLSRLWDRAGSLTGVLDSLDFAMFAMLCVAGLGAARTGGSRSRPTVHA